MPRPLLLLALAICFALPAKSQPVTGLSDWSLYLDQGHSQNGNVGVFGYSEARKVLRVGLELQDLLLTETDIDTVYVSRTNDQESVSLSQRVDEANALNADHFHSIHSNAAAPSANFVFVLWPQLINGEEPAPPYDGGKRWAKIMGPMFGRGMRIPVSSEGDWGECDFYGASSCRSTTTTPKGSRNFVQSFTLMPSALSEAGFHTNPTQNQRNMNADWKRLEARAMFWAILDYHELDRPAAHITTGIIADIESGEPINGATITIGDTTYTTDTFDSLFNQYSDDPDQLHNGFYYLDDLNAGPLAVTVEAEGYETFTGEVTPVDTFFTFLDIELISTVPPVVTATTPSKGAPSFRITDPLVFEFSRPMNTESVEAAFSIDPSIEGTFVWEDDNMRLLFDPESFEPRTTYAVMIAGTAEGFYEDLLDGDGDGTGGDAFSLSFTTGFEDAEPPRIVAAAPRPNATDVELRPVVTVTYSELIDAASLEGLVTLEPTSGGASVAGDVVAYDVGEQSVVSFFPEADLTPETSYRLFIAPGVEDLFLNTQTSGQQVIFTTGSTDWSVTHIDDFEGDVADDWWAPQQSGSTVGIVTEETGAVADTDVYNLLSGGTSSFRLDYGWNPNNAPWLIRVCYEDCANSTPAFDASYTLQAYVFGDGKANQFRFAVDDAGGTEVSPWFTIDWLGWQLVSWDMDEDGVGSWLTSSNGTLDGTLHFESIQLSYVPDGPTTGRYYVDDLRIVKELSTADEPDASTPTAFRLHANYPNPFASRTTVTFDLPEAAPVTATIFDVRGAEVLRLADDAVFPAGTHDLTWDARGLASGVYVLRLVAGEASASSRMVLVR